MPEPRRPKTRRAGTLALALALLAALLLPSTALSEPRATDVVDGIAASSRSTPLASLPDVTLKSGLLVDSDGRVLWARNSGERRSIASITKIMTAIVAIESASMDATVTIPQASVSVGESSANLKPGQKLPMRDVLAALLVKSGNDAAVAIALSVAGTVPEFVNMMNAKAASLGLANTHFTNPHGLDAPDHYSSAEDIAVLSRYAMANPEFRRIVGMKSVTIGTGKQQETLQSTDLLLGNYLGAMGIKTGYTSAAGYSVVSAAQRDGITLYAVVLGTSSDLQRFRDAQALLDWGFTHYRMQRLAEAGTVLAEVSVRDYLDVVVTAAVSEETSIAVLDANGTITRSVSVSSVDAPVKKGDLVGVAQFTQAGKLVATVPLVATADVKKPNILERVWIAMVRGWRSVFGSSVLGGAVFFSAAVESKGAAVAY
ncbi:MAG: D-alanyl-D-alanine carboxypeptidase [Coriobacteriia bacterium]|nr:D-alanyl-D-alanine carboxypeptidase [Coriobacteriia bacterium]